MDTEIALRVVAAAAAHFIDLAAVFGNAFDGTPMPFYSTSLDCLDLIQCLRAGISAQ